MRSEKELLQEFNNEFGGHLSDYALLRNGECQYDIINVRHTTMLILEDIEIANFFITKLLELGVPVYSNTKEIPGWKVKTRERPPEINPSLKKIVESIKKKEE